MIWRGREQITEVSDPASHTRMGHPGAPAIQHPGVLWSIGGGGRGIKALTERSLGPPQLPQACRP